VTFRGLTLDLSSPLGACYDLLEYNSWYNEHFIFHTNLFFLSLFPGSLQKILSGAIDDILGQTYDPILQTQNIILRSSFDVLVNIIYYTVIEIVIVLHTKNSCRKGKRRMNFSKTKRPNSS